MTYYDYYYDYPSMDAFDSVLGGTAGFVLVFAVLVYLLALAYGILNYVLCSLSMYTIAKRRGIHNPWLSWVPLGNLWILGSISDQYQYVVKGKTRGRRKVLLGLSASVFLMMVPVVIGAVVLALGITGSAASVGAGAAIILLAYLAIVVLGIILMVFEYIALYDLFVSCNPSNAVLYLVLTIFFGVVLPFFMFSCRKKDLGMVPPRPAYQQPQFQQPQYQQPQQQDPDQC